MATDTREIIKTVEVGDAPDAFAVHPDGRMMYVSSSFGGTISEIDMITETVLRTFFVGGTPAGHGGQQKPRQKHRRGGLRSCR